MATQVTQGIKISVETVFNGEHSDPSSNYYLFNYRITIENIGDFPVQLLRRHWEISDSNGEIRIVEGEGVVGETPIIEPGEIYRYESACNLKSDIGKMRGWYIMEKVSNASEITVEIPEFQLVTPFRMN